MEKNAEQYPLYLNTKHKADEYCSLFIPESRSQDTD